MPATGPRVVAAAVTAARTGAYGSVRVLAPAFPTAAVAAADLVAVGLRVGSLPTDLRLAGLHAVRPVVPGGAASVVAGDVPTGPFAPAVRRAFVAAGVAPTWPAVVAAHLTVRLAVVAVCGRLARWRTAVRCRVVLVVSAAAPWSGTAALAGALPTDRGSGAGSGSKDDGLGDPVGTAGALLAGAPAGLVLAGPMLPDRVVVSRPIVSAGLVGGYLLAGVLAVTTVPPCVALPHIVATSAER